MSTPFDNNKTNNFGWIGKAYFVIRVGKLKILSLITPTTTSFLSFQGEENGFSKTGFINIYN